MGVYELRAKTELISFKYVCIQMVRFLPQPLVILKTLGGLVALQALLFGRGGSAAVALLSQGAAILVAYLMIFFGLKPWAKKYSPRPVKRVRDAI